MALRSPFWLVLLPVLCLLPACGASSSTSSPSNRAAALPTEPSLAAPLPGSYAALGASETYGVGVTPRTRSYPYLVARALHARRFADVGIPGATIISGYENELSRALDIRPSFCTVLFGTNDILGGESRTAFVSNLYDLVATLRRARARVLIIGLPDLSYFPRVSQAHLGGVHGIVTSWNAGMRSVARRTHSSYLDLAAYSRILARHPEYITADGLHPAATAHARLAALIVSRVRKDRLWRDG